MLIHNHYQIHFIQDNNQGLTPAHLQCGWMRIVEVLAAEIIRKAAATESKKKSAANSNKIIDINKQLHLRLMT